MTYLFVALSAIFSLVALFFLTKLIGARQISQLSLFDYVNGITIGSIAAEMATAEFPGALRCLVALAVYCCAGALLSHLCVYFLPLRRFAEGRTKFLLDGGHLYETNFRKSGVSLNEFLVAAREAGYFDLAQIETAVLEPNGRISFLPKSAFRPVTPDDLNLTPPACSLARNVVLDGDVMKGNLTALGYNEQWLNRMLTEQGYDGTARIFLATVQADGTLSVFPRKEKKRTRKTGLE